MTQWGVWFLQSPQWGLPKDGLNIGALVVFVQQAFMLEILGPGIEEFGSPTR